MLNTSRHNRKSARRRSDPGTPSLFDDLPMAPEPPESSEPAIILQGEGEHPGTTAGPSDEVDVVKKESEEQVSDWILPLPPDKPTKWQRAISEARQQAHEIDDEYSYAPHQTRTQKLRQLLAIRRIAREYGVSAADLRRQVLYEPDRKPWGQDNTSGLLEELTGHAATAELARTALTVPNGPLIRNHKRAKTAIELAREQKRIR